MQGLRKAAVKWAKLQMRQPPPFLSSVLDLGLGLAFLGVYFFGTSHPALLALGVLLLAFALLRFERAGFIALYREERGDVEAGGSVEPELAYENSKRRADDERSEAGSGSLR